MTKKFTLGRYESYSYDRFHCIRPSLLLTAAMVFLCRGFIASIAMAATTMTGAQTNIHRLLLVNSHWSSFVAAIPAILVMCALSARVPNANKLIRVTWKRGRLLLILSDLLQIALLEDLKIRNFSVARLDNFSDESLAILFVNLLILSYVIFSRRVKDTFSDFPTFVNDQKDK